MYLSQPACVVCRPVERLLIFQANLVDAGVSADLPGAGVALCFDVEVAASLAWALVLNQGWSDHRQTQPRCWLLAFEYAAVWA